MIYLNEKKVNVKKFLNGEFLINSEDLKINEEINIIKFKFESDEDIIYLIFLKGYLDELNCECIFEIFYMFYSRMDRIEGKIVFIFKYLCKLINFMNFDKVYIYELYFDVFVVLLDRVSIINIFLNIVKKVLEKFFKEEKCEELVYLVYLDVGVEKRYSK